MSCFSVSIEVKTVFCETGKVSFREKSHSTLRVRKLKGVGLLLLRNFLCRGFMSFRGGII